MTKRAFAVSATIAVLLLAAGIALKVVADRRKSAAAASVPRPERFGLVLSGGGAKGAYEVGVWKALAELGVTTNLAVISGTSIGAINASLFAGIGLHDADRCEDFWFAGMDSVIDAGMKKAGRSLLDAALDADGDLDGLKLVKGIADQAEMRRVLSGFLPESWPVTPPAVYVTAFSQEAWAVRRFPLAGRTKAECLDRLLASSAIPGVFGAVNIDGENFTDGGWGMKDAVVDKVPFAPVVENFPEVTTVIVVYLGSADHLAGRVRPEQLPGKRLVEIIPSKNIDYGGGYLAVMDYGVENLTGLIRLGYGDAMRAFGRTPSDPVPVSAYTPGKVREIVMRLIRKARSSADASEMVSSSIDRARTSTSAARAEIESLLAVGVEKAVEIIDGGESDKSADEHLEDARRCLRLIRSYIK